MNPRNGLVIALGLCVSSLLAGPSTGGGFALSGLPVGGGGHSTGGNLAVSGVAGSPGGVSSGGGFQISGGLLGVYVVPGGVELTLTRANGNATLTWPAGTTGYTLQFTSQLGPAANWQPVTPAPVGNIYTTTFNQPARFYRLHQP